MKKISYLLLLCVFMLSCTDKVQNATVVKSLPQIYPDYIGVTIPAGIAPLNFDFAGGDLECMDVVIKGSKGGEIHSNGTTADFDIDDWHELTNLNKGGQLIVSVAVKKDGAWTRYGNFTITVSPYALDEYGLTYRRIAPGYEVYSKMGIYQRDLTNFDEESIIENTQIHGGCVNCHTSNRTNPDNFLFHVRGDKGATVVQISGKRKTLNTKTDKTIGLCVYPYWHPSGDFVAFSTNTTRQAFHEVRNERIEVFDQESDLEIYNTKTDELILSPLVMTKNHFETYPVFSPDGKTLYFCSSDVKQIPGEYKDIKYNICKISFDPAKGMFGNKVDTIFNARSLGKSATHPRPSYDGKYIMFTMSDYGCFPIWHKEADNWLLNLKTGKAEPMVAANSKNTDSWHNWNLNSHWFVFTSRRGDGLYTRLYLASVDDRGRVSKPFLLPQRNPLKYYNESLYSYNTPDFTSKPVEFDAREGGREIMSDERIPLKVR